jgi:hypothetical protein
VDNSALGDRGTGPSTPNAGTGDGVDADLANLAQARQLTERHRQQITGARDEMQRVKRDLADKEAALARANEAFARMEKMQLEMAELRGAVNARQSYDLSATSHADNSQAQAPPRSQNGPSEAWMEAQRELLGYDAPDDKLAALWQAQVGSGGINADEAQRLYEQREKVKADQMAVGNMLSQHYPELGDPTHPFTLRTIEVYQNLANDPRMAAIFGQGMPVTDPGTGSTFNSAIVMQAASMVRSEAAQAGNRNYERQAAPTMGIPGGSYRGGGQPHPDGVISKSMAGLLSEPELTAAMGKAGMGNTPRQIWGNLKSGVSASVKDGWERDARTQGVSHTRS